MTLVPQSLFGRLFAALLTGNESYAGRTLHACARAAYGGPSTVTATAVTVSECEWDYLTANGSALPPPPGVQTPAQGVEGAIYLHDPDGVNPSYCPTDPSGKTAPGGFGWLADTTGGCGATGTPPTPRWRIRTRPSVSPAPLLPASDEREDVLAQRSPSLPF